MPNWKVHLEIGNRINQKLNYNQDNLSLLLFGSILPDVNNGYIVKGVSKKLPHDYTHFTSFLYKGYTIFYEKYGDNVRNNPLLQGYVAHLITDYFWNNYFYTDFYKTHTQLQTMGSEELRILKQDDFRIYDNLFYKDTIECTDINLIEKNVQKIDEVEINNNDISSVLDYIKKKAEVKPENGDFKILKKEELDKLMDDTIKFILKYFEENKLY